nr:hypothetical protein [Burkholderiales bacterium]
MNPKIEYVLMPAIWYQELSLVKQSSKHLPINCAKGIVLYGPSFEIIRSLMFSLKGLVTSEKDVGKFVEGFVTNLHNFVDKQTAYDMAVRANQPVKSSGPNLTYKDLL